MSSTKTPYTPKIIEDKWAKVWDETKAFKAEGISSAKPKVHVLDMFPYPSGEGLHIGHTKVFTASDVYARFKRMRGYNVLHATGWDAFGLPAEQYALKHKVHPKDTTKKNTDTFRRQMKLLGLSYDWDREVNTTDPNFYKWTQWIFLQLWNKGLVKEVYEPINWCPSCKTGLANEDLEGNACERCGTIVEKKPLRQFSIEITKYAEKLLDGLNDLDWKENVKDLERNWIGKSEGTEIDFKIKTKAFENKFTIFTTRPDTLFGCTYCVMAPEHALVSEMLASGQIENKAEVEKYIEEVKLKTEIERSAEGREKTGVELKGVKAVNPANNEEVPIFIADYVLATYGTGAIMAVPAHDERDFEFANKYDLPMKDVIERPIGYPIDKLYTGYGKVHNSIVWADGLLSEDAKLEIVGHVGGKMVTKYKLRDWVFARQRYWGEPFPLVHVLEKNDKGEEVKKIYPVDESDLPVVLPDVKDYEPTGTGESPLANIDEWVNVKGYVTKSSTFLTQNKKHSKRELDTIETYNRNIDTYVHSTPSVPSDEFVKELKLLVPIFTGKKVIEIGSATGRDALFLRDLGVFVETTDIAEGFGPSLMEKGFDFKKVDPLLDDLGTDVYDGIISLASLLHSEKRNFKQILCNFNQSLKDGGHIYLRLKNGSGESEEDSKGGYRFFSYYNEIELKKILIDVGFEVERVSFVENNKWINVLAKKTSDLKFVSAKRETNTMPQWAGSSWYWLRYMDPTNSERFVGRDAEKYWGQVDIYLGGMEHATRHLIYGRFWHRFLYDIGELTTPEPFKRLEAVGLVLGEGGVKMSKRLGNVINPDDVADQWGVDTLRTYILFMGPYHDSVAWNSKNLIGPRRFLERVWAMQYELGDGKLSKETDILLNQTIKKLTEDNEALRFNTGVSALMILFNVLEKETVSKENYLTFLKLLAPYAPFLTEEIWQSLGQVGSIHHTSWPSFDADKLKSATVTIAVQYNGRVRDTVEVSNNAPQAEVEQAVRSSASFAKWVGEQEIKKVIFVPNKIINLIV